MKIFILKQVLTWLGSLDTLKNPLNLYGSIRENEELCHVMDIGINHRYLPVIGQVRNDLPSSSNIKLAVLIQHGELIFYYKKGKNWQRSEQHVINPDDLFKRTPFPKNLIAKLKSARVVIFGIGSGGSRLALGLAKSGIEKFNLIDPDKFSVENVSRQECDLFDIGRYKVNAAKDKILRVNTCAEIRAYPFDVFQKPAILEKIFSNANLVIGATDKTSVQLKINYECWHRKIPTLFGGCYEEAKGGEILFVLPGETSVCLECVKGGISQPEKLGKIDYSIAQGPEDYQGEPGLNAAINLITDVAQQYAIALLLRNEDCEMAKLINPNKNLLFIGGALGEGYYLFKKPFHFISPVLKGPWKNCGTCQNGMNKNADKIIKKAKKEVM